MRLKNSVLLYRYCVRVVAKETDSQIDKTGKNKPFSKSSKSGKVKARSHIFKLPSEKRPKVVFRRVDFARILLPYDLSPQPSGSVVEAMCKKFMHMFGVSIPFLLMRQLKDEHFYRKQGKKTQTSKFVVIKMSAVNIFKAFHKLNFWWIPAGYFFRLVPFYRMIKQLGTDTMRQNKNGTLNTRPKNRSYKKDRFHCS